MKPFVILLAWGSLLSTIALGQAQTFPSPATKSDWASLRTLIAGAEIRVMATNHKTIRGTFRSVSDDVLIVDRPSGEGVIARTSIISVSLKKESRRIRHMLIGLGVGAAGGVAAGAALDATESCRYTDFGCVPEPGVGRTPSTMPFTTPIGAILGLGVGALLPAGGRREIYRMR